MHLYIDPRAVQTTAAFNREDLHLPDRFEEVFGDRPVRIVQTSASAWSALRFRPDTWTPEQAEAAGVPLDDANERGITILTHATLGPAPLHRYADRPQLSARRNGNRVRYSFTDTLNATVSEEHRIQPPTTSGPIVEVMPRLIAHLCGLEYIASYLIDYARGAEDNAIGASAAYLSALSDAVVNSWSMAMECLDHDAELDTSSIMPELDYDLVSRIITERSSEGINHLRNMIDNNVDALRERQDSIRLLQDQLRTQQAQMEVLRRNVTEVTPADVEREIGAIQRHAHVDAFFMTGERRETSSLTVLTTQIPMPHPRDAYIEPVMMGPYEITMRFGQGRNVSITNLVNPRGGYEHPHVRGGDFCAGNWQSTVNELLAQGQLAAAVNFICACLEQVNADDAWGANYRLWFEDAE